MEFILKVEKFPVAYMELPAEFKRDFLPYIPIGMSVNVDNISYPLEILPDFKDTKLRIGGQAFITLCHEKNVTAGFLLHFVIQKTGPNYLYFYDKLGFCDTSEYPNLRRGNRIRYATVVQDPTSGFLMIQSAWFNQFTPFFNSKSKIWVVNESFEVDVFVNGERPAGFIGQGLVDFFDHYFNVKGCVVVFESYPQVFEFKMKLFDPNGVDYINDSGVFLPNEHIRLDSDLVPCHYGPLPHKEFYKLDQVFTTPTRAKIASVPDTQSFRKRVGDILACNGLHIPAWFVNEYKLNQVASPVTVRCGGYQTEMRLKCYGDQRLGEGASSNHVVLKGTWKELQEFSNFRARKSLKFVLDLDVFRNSGYVVFNVY